MYSSLKLFPEKDFFLHCSFIFKCGTSEVASSQNPAHRTVSPCDCSLNFSMHFMPYSKFHYVSITKLYNPYTISILATIMYLFNF